MDEEERLLPVIVGCFTVAAGSFWVVAGWIVNGGVDGTSLLVLIVGLSILAWQVIVRAAARARRVTGRE